MKSISKLSQIYASILVNSVYAMKNYPVMLVNTLLAPLSILLIITFVSHGTLLSVAIIGALITSMVSSGIGMQSDLAHLKNDFKMQDMVVSSPTTAFTYLIGMAISEIIYALPAIIILIILAILFVHVGILQALTIILVLALMFSFATALGFMLSTFSSDVMQSWAFFGILSTILTTIPPIYYPVTYIPMPYRYIAYISPTTYAAEIAQNAIGYLQLPLASLVRDWIVIIIVSAVLFTIAIKKNRWRET